MHTVMAQRGRNVSVLMMVVMMMMVMVSLSSADGGFSWSDCGIQLNKAIHYQSAAISPTTATIGQSLSVNVQATLSPVNRKIVNAQTRLMVWKDGTLFTDVHIDDLCTIISSTKALSCPLHEGLVSFTYEFDKVPSLPSGEYVIEVKNYDMTPGITEDMEIGCIQFTGTVSGLLNDDRNNCSYESSFNVQLKGDAHYTNSVRTARKEGDLIQIGPMGNLTGGSSFGYGTFVGNFMGTADLGGDQVPTKDYTWALNGTLMSHIASADTQRIIDVYSGTFYVLYDNGTRTVINFLGYFNWTFDYDPSRQELVTGTLWLDPEYYMLPQFTWPVVLGNLGQFSVRTLDNGNFIVAGSKLFCTCGVDACGLCNGDGRTCGLGAPQPNNNKWGIRKRAAVGCGAAALLLIIVVAELSRRIHKERGRMPVIDDQDLLDHPEKPDYGTMAIDDAIREGERVA